ncbi:MAG: signal peptide peptidase SppA [Deltaproteobacteria bacterium]|nr:signal peptide peptidase SppA [Deltaproteobacteria bacterium]
MISPYLLALCLAIPEVGAEAVALPTDVSGYAVGASSAAFDPAAPALAVGLELHLRARLPPNDDGRARIGFYGVYAGEVAAPYVGCDWLPAPGAHHQRLTLGVAVPFASYWSIGVALRSYLARDPAYNGVRTVDAGIAAQLTSWLSMSGGVDSLTQPKLGDARQPLLWRLGAAVRPIFGAPWLTIGFDLRTGAESLRAASSRLVAELGVEGLHAQAIYEPKDDTLWLGFSLALFGTEVQAASVPDRARWAPAKRRADTALAATLRSEPRESLVDVYERTVEVTLDGDLTPPVDGLLSARPQIADPALTLAALAGDKSVGTVILTIGELEVGLATIDELRRAIHELRAAGKTVVAELTHASDKEYMVAAAAQRIRMDPAATLRLDGFAVTKHYFAELLAKVGIHVESIEVGRYKSAPDALTRAGPRPEDLEVEGAVLVQAFTTLVAAVVDDRRLPKDKVLALIDRGGFTAPEALAQGLIDELSQPVDPNRLPVGRARGEEVEDRRRSSTRWGGQPVVAVVPVVGTIVMRGKDNPLPGPSAAAPKIVEQLEAAMTDAEVGAIVMRIDSGGGDVFASEMIWRAARRAAEHKPLVVSMGDSAASGGYYIAAPAHLILAEANTITGSIGIFTLKFDLSHLFDVAGIRSHVYKQGAHADWDRIDLPLDDAARQRLTEVMRSYYDTFIGRVAAGRKLPEARVRAIAEGRVYTGTQALGVGLVDGIGGLVDAVREAAARADLGGPAEWTVQIPKRSLEVGELLERLSMADASLGAAWRLVSEQARALDGQPLALMPYRLEVGP